MVHASLTAEDISAVDAFPVVALVLAALAVEFFHAAILFLV
jgi:hypothetical protein